MTDTKSPLRKVWRATQSPMNAKRWALDLECGHEVWVTANRRPTRQKIRCDRCLEHQRSGGKEL